MKNTNTNTAQTAKRILFNVKFEGQGIVNYDDSTLQVKLLQNVNSWNGQLFRTTKQGGLEEKKNITLAKKEFTKVGTKDNGKPIYDYRIKVSRNAILHDLYREVDLAKSASIMLDDQELYLDITTKESLFRGYMYAPSTKTKKMTIRRKGALTLVDALQTCNAVSKLEMGGNHKTKVSQELEKNDGEEANTAKDTSIFEREQVGDIKYESKGNFINLAQLELISASPEMDRVAFNPDLTDKWLNSFNINFLGDGLTANDAVEVGSYKLNSSASNLKEYGILMKPNLVNLLVKDFFKRLMKLNIKRNGSYMKVSSIEICLENDNLDVDANNEKVFFTLTPQVLNELHINYESAYTKVEDEIQDESETESNTKAKTKKAK